MQMVSLLNGVYGTLTSMHVQVMNQTVVGTVVPVSLSMVSAAFHKSDDYIQIVEKYRE